MTLGRCAAVSQRLIESEPGFIVVMGDQPGRCQQPGLQDGHSQKGERNTIARNRQIQLINGNKSN